MAAPYTSVTVLNYNLNPPPDDGSQVPANRLAWSNHTSKIGGPLKTAIEAVNTNVLAAIAKMVGGAGITSTAITYGVLTGDQGKLVVATASGITITTPDATSVGSPFVFSVLNNSSGDVTLDGSGSQTINGSPTLTMKAGDGWLVYTDGTNWFVIGRKTGVLPRGYIDGCLLANGTDATNDINFAAGVCRDSTNAVDITVAAMGGKQLDANWAPGAAAGMRNSAVGIANTTYHLYAVMKADGTQDFYAHTSTTVATVITALQAESGGALYVYARLVGSIIRASGSILAFTQDGDQFDLSTPTLDINRATPGATANTETLSVPVGVRVLAFLNISAAANNLLYVSSLSQADLAPLDNGAPLASTFDGGNQNIGQCRVRTDVLGRVRSRCNNNTQIYGVTTGWLHPRGKDA